MIVDRRRSLAAGIAAIVSLAGGKDVLAEEEDALWVSASGDDRQTGTREQPLETMHEAFRRETERVILLPGRHLPAHLTGGKKRLEAPWGGVTIAGINQSAPRFGLDRDRRDAWGFERRVPADTPGAEIVREIWLTVVRDATLTIEPGILFEGGGIYATNSDVTMRSCVLKFSEGHGVTMFGGRFRGEALRIHAPQGDGFNYNDGCIAFERDCWVSDAGYGESWGLTSNGSSSHGCTVTRYGGLYESSMGPDIADIWMKGAYSENFGVTVRNSRVGIGFRFGGGESVPKFARLVGCRAEGEMVDVFNEHSQISIEGVPLRVSTRRPAMPVRPGQR
jgi:hypothetical protein